MSPQHRYDWTHLHRISSRSPSVEATPSAFSSKRQRIANAHRHRISSDLSVSGLSDIEGIGFSRRPARPAIIPSAERAKMDEYIAQKVIASVSQHSDWKDFEASKIKPFRVKDLLTQYRFSRYVMKKWQGRVITYNESSIMTTKVGAGTILISPTR